ncbi:flagellin [Stenotrophobium rhamnosiphilum]|uniref:Flagellin n=1 Tax=Stenotrophobium rhamnosiphilum TaxID=2029166 RepID=A0A2T5MDH0_9GAMM|nr:flagellin [Stenotrophobium rhamnosiphilum]PTU30597.1 flagellin [Stenotrophobium rhamnosiphilum]
MSSVINTNVMSLVAQQNLSNSQSSLQTSMSRLSSGMRINSAKDDAAGLGISQRMTAQINGLDQAARNANDGISLTQTAEGALQQVTTNLQRIRELAVQSANGSNSSIDRASLNAEAQQLMSENNRVAQQQQYNGVNLLDGSFSNQSFQIGANAGQVITVGSIVNANASALGTYTSASVTGAAATTLTAVTAGDLTINGVSVGAVGAASSATQRASQIRDAINSVADQTGVFAINDTGTTVTLNSSGNSGITVAMSGTGTTATTGLTAAVTAAATQTGYATLDLSTSAGATLALTQMDAALNDVNTARGNLGAYQSRFASVISNLQTTSTNLSAARSRITDADFAQETANMTRAQILQQAGTAMVAQANSAPQGVLKLLQG